MNTLRRHISNNTSNLNVDVFAPVGCRDNNVESDSQKRKSVINTLAVWRIKQLPDNSQFVDHYAFTDNFLFHSDL